MNMMKSYTTSRIVFIKRANCAEELSVDDYDDANESTGIYSSRSSGSRS